MIINTENFIHKKYLGATIGCKFTGALFFKNKKWGMSKWLNRNQIKYAFPVVLCDNFSKNSYLFCKLPHLI